MIWKIIGYISFSILIILAIIWGIGVRKKLDASHWTIFGAFLFLASAILLIVFQINLLHSLWIIPSIFILTLVTPYIYVYNIPILKNLVSIVSNIYSKLLRVGINQKY